MVIDIEQGFDSIGLFLKQVPIKEIEDCLSESLSNLIDRKVNFLKINRLQFVEHDTFTHSIEIELTIKNDPSKRTNHLESTEEPG